MTAEVSNANLTKANAALAQRAAALAEEIDWFHSYHWPADRIAKRLGVTTAYVRERLHMKAER